MLWIDESVGNKKMNTVDTCPHFRVEAWFQRWLLGLSCGGEQRALLDTPAAARCGEFKGSCFLFGERSFILKYRSYNTCYCFHQNRQGFDEKSAVRFPFRALARWKRYSITRAYKSPRGMEHTKARKELHAGGSNYKTTSLFECLTRCISLRIVVFSTDWQGNEWPRTVDILSS